MGYWIVVVDDEPLSLKNAKDHLSRNDMRVSCLRSGRDLLTFMKMNEPDLILLDILMPEMDGFETYRELRKYEDMAGRPQIPVIFLTGEKDSETERRGLKAGASDFIHKPFDKDILIKRIVNTINNSRTIESLTEEATLDKLTGFLNKSSGSEKAASLCRTRSGSLMILDLDNFKLVNDIYGHDMGDRILVSFSDIVRHNVRSQDVISRIGGDEFMAFFVDLISEDAVASLVCRLNEQLEQKAASLMGSDHGIPLGISVGCAFAPEQSNEYQILFQYADSALYRVKMHGKHGYGIYDPGTVDSDDADDLERDLSRVIQIISERSETKGAMMLGQEAFLWNYRFIIRFLKRYGGCANRILFSVTAEDKGALYNETIAQFGNVLKNSLRKSDIIFQYRPNQFFVVMPHLSQKDTPVLIRRVLKAWDNLGYSDRVKIECKESFISFEGGHES